MAGNATDEDRGLRPIDYVLHDRDGKFCVSFDSLLNVVGVSTLRLLKDLQSAGNAGKYYTPRADRSCSPAARRHAIHFVQRRGKPAPPAIPRQQVEVQRRPVGQ